MKCSGALLAGGESRRMGLDKAGMLVGGVPLWQRQIAILRETGVDEVLVSGPDRPEWRDAGLIVVEDEPPACGPLGGLVSVLRRTAHPLILVLAVDMPSMTSAFLRTLVDSGGAHIGIVPKIGQRYEPLAAAYPAAALVLAQECLAQGALSLQGFVSRAVASGLVRERVMAAAERALFFNVNTPGDLAGFTTL